MVGSEIKGMVCVSLDPFSTGQTSLAYEKLDLQV